MPFLILLVLQATQYHEYLVYLQTLFICKSKDFNWIYYVKTK